jgi:hypothetical protein
MMTNNWKFKDEREDVISFPSGLTHEERREYIRKALELYDTKRQTTIVLDGVRSRTEKDWYK